ncbi:MAG TPA: hybrid sensor histidine kinase/response regulator [Desulfobacteraceae bacterium]|nr:hybrid sensor histidine kinase/response regulator [Desulfobacteraceae bacterium]
MKKRSENAPPKKKMDPSIARLMGLGERSVQKSYYPQLQQKIRELEKSEHRYRLLAENISDIIWLLDADLSILYISPSIERVSGIASQALEGRSFLTLLEPGDARRFDREVSAFGGHTLEMELKQRNADESFTWIEVRVSVLSGDQGRQLLGISRDITERKQAEADREAMQLQLLQAQKMESIGTLAGGIAHDFNNLLTVINGYADLVLKKTDADDPLFRKISAISSAGRRAGELTRQLLAFSRKQIYSPSTLRIPGVIRDMERMLRRLIGEDILVDTRIDTEISPISADQTQVEQIFTNLVINARDALDGIRQPGFKKRITIEAGQTRIDSQTAAKLRIPKAGDYVFFSVSDNGRGMDRETRKRIFEPFFTTKTKYKGTGLGLAMVYGIVKQNRGSIRVYSEPGHGALFKIYWPAAKIAGERPARKTAAEVRQLAGDELILLVEDDVDVLDFAANALKSLGYETQTSENGSQALEWMISRKSAGQPLPDLVVTDLIMPELGGKDFVKQASALVPALKAIYVSGHTDNHIVHNGMLDPGVNFLQKPYSQQQLALKIRSVLAG